MCIANRLKLLGGSDLMQESSAFAKCDVVGDAAKEPFFQFPLLETEMFGNAGLGWLQRAVVISYWNIFGFPAGNRAEFLASASANSYTSTSHKITNHHIRGCSTGLTGLGSNAPNYGTVCRASATNNEAVSTPAKQQEHPVRTSDIREGRMGKLSTGFWSHYQHLINHYQHHHYSISQPGVNQARTGRCFSGRQARTLHSCSDLLLAAAAVSLDL
ncbi:hypothetical protein Nepgr_029717 [Nepenthes gracilis]|uniref:Uncharacterized protein n=1 Tax=Nepenthes gracilis TaxID=150966 RepID=A0AAD3TEW1_NEPGR|nr:hypothetical protein Nepgr_029717 [Nepenthes gracilis]